MGLFLLDELQLILQINQELTYNDIFAQFIFPGMV